MEINPPAKADPLDHMMIKEDVMRDLENQLIMLEKRFLSDFSKIVRGKQQLEKDDASLARTAGRFGSGIGRSAAGQDTVFPHSASKEKVKIFPYREEMPLRQKLAKKRAVADELEDKLQAARDKFPEEIAKVSLKQSEIEKREKLLIKSVEEIEAYLKAVFFMRLEANDVLRQQKEESRSLEVEFKKLETEFKRLEQRQNLLKKLTLAFRPAKKYMDDIVSLFSRFSNTEEVVNYFHILKHLNHELIEKELTYQMEEKQIKLEEEAVAEALQLHPYEILARETKLRQANVDLHVQQEKRTHMEEKMNSQLHSKANEDTLWGEMQRWIKKTHRIVSANLDIPSTVDAKDEAMNHLNRIADFFRIATTIVDNLK